MSRVLVVSPHPDDESIGCGGALRKHAVEGDEVRVVFLTSGEMGIPGRKGRDAARVREVEAEKAAEILGVSSIEFWHEPDGALRVHRELVGRCAGLLEEWSPDRIYVTHEGDMHPDHRAAARLVRHAVPAGDEGPTVLEFEVWTPLKYLSEIVDITPHIEEKLDAIRCYQSQCDLMRFDDAMLGLNRYRGEMHSWPGGEYAEVFWSPR